VVASPPPRVEAVAGELVGADAAPEETLEALRFEELRVLDDAVRAAAVDGGQSVLIDLGTSGVVALRAGYTLREPPDHYLDVIPLNELRLLTRRRLDAIWREFTRHHDWGTHLEAPRTPGSKWVRPWCESLRRVAEFDLARRALRALREGDLLLLDGSLDDEAEPSGLVTSLLEAARRMGVHVVAVTKDTSLTLGGVFPVTLEVEQRAVATQAPARFAVDVGDALGRSGPFATYAARFDARAPVYRVDVASARAPDLDVLGLVASLCGDVAYLGYPYPLARIHDRVHFAADQSGDLKHQLEALVAQRRGSLYSLRLFGRGRDVLTMGD
jgi:hypothetical protein